MSYFAKDEKVYINSDLFPQCDEGVVESAPEEGEAFYDVLVTVANDDYFVNKSVPFVEDELTKFTDE